MNEITYTFHTPVLVDEVVGFLPATKSSWVVDATAGGGGHTGELLRTGRKVLAIDQDAEAVNELKRQFGTELEKRQLKIAHGNFAHLLSIIKANKVESVAAVLFDLGLSTFQIKRSGRGFSFQSDEALDMRMNTEAAETAKDLLNQASQEELTGILLRFGEERLAAQIAEKIVKVRRQKTIETTEELTRLVNEVYEEVGIHSLISPATRTFQAIRIYINDELKVLRDALPQAFESLDRNGRLLVISFHSLEDRIVKQYFQSQVVLGKARLVNKKPMIAGEGEVKSNRSARSAKLRVLTKL